MGLDEKEVYTTLPWCPVACVVGVPWPVWLSGALGGIGVDVVSLKFD